MFNCVVLGLVLIINHCLSQLVPFHLLVSWYHYISTQYLRFIGYCICSSLVLLFFCDLHRFLQVKEFLLLFLLFLPDLLNALTWVCLHVYLFHRLLAVNTNNCDLVVAFIDQPLYCPSVRNRFIHLLCEHFLPHDFADSFCHLVVFIVFVLILLCNLLFSHLNPLV